MSYYSVHKVAKLAGVSVRTLHHYDRLGLLRPAVRTEARYRLYGNAELLRLQQILFYRELDFSLEEILQILQSPQFELLTALQKHRQALEAKRDRLSVLLDTVDKTLLKLKGEQVMLTDEELYDGFPKGKAEDYRHEVVEKYGVQVVEESENKVRQLGKASFERLKAEQKDIHETLASMTNLDPSSAMVQAQIARHYAVILAFWGKAVGCESQWSAYEGLAQVYLDDLRYTSQDGAENPAFASFLNKAMRYFVDRKRAG